MASAQNTPASRRSCGSCVDLLRRKRAWSLKTAPGKEAQVDYGTRSMVPRSNEVLKDLKAVGVRSYVPEPDRGRRNWGGKQVNKRRSMAIVGELGVRAASGG